MPAIRQSVIPLELVDPYAFDSFYSDQNRLLIDELKQLIVAQRSKPLLYFYGPRGSGKSHLLRACCALARAQRRPQHYLASPAAATQPWLDALQPNTLVCIDDLEQVQAKPDWQYALLCLFERIALSGSGGSLLVAAKAPPSQLQLSLADLTSRLYSGGVYRLTELGDQAKCEALKHSAHKRGFELSSAVLNFIMTHYQRDTAALFALLARLDAQSLSQQRRITVPLVKTVL